MTYHTAIVFVVIICSVNAAYIINAPDDAVSSNHVEDVTTCIDSSCNALCQDLGFTDGICVNGQCKCERKEGKTDETDQRTSSEPVTEILVTGVDSCSPLECDQDCRRIGFPGGACVNDHCKCDIIKNDDKLQPAEKAVDSCSPLGCDQDCRRIGFPGGACVNDHCKCDIIKNDDKLQPAEKAVDSCSPLGCDQDCRRIGFPGGACVNDHCKCDILEKDEENEISVYETIIRKQVVFRAEENPAVSARSSVSRGSCDCIPYNCDKYCFRIHYIGGICVDGHCRCYK